MQLTYNWIVRMGIFILTGALAGLMSKALMNVIKRLYIYSQNIGESYKSFLVSLAKVIDARDEYTRYHSEKVANIAVLIGEKMDLSHEKLSILYWAAQLHDIGKIGVPNKILRKSGPLTEDEWEVMKHHSKLGSQIISSVKFVKPISRIIRSHHEMWDGSGYPDGLKAEKIPLLSRIITIADVYQALTSDRSYRKAWPVKQAKTFIQKNSGKMFDPEIVEVFLSINENELEKK